MTQSQTKITLWVFLIFTLITPAAIGEQIANDWQNINLTSKAHRFRLDKNPELPFRTGALIYRGGVSLSSTHENFGGFSGLHISADGQSLLAISDRAHWLKADIDYSEDGHLQAVSNAKMAAMKNKQGAPFKRSHADSEGLSVFKNQVLVSFERTPRIEAYHFNESGDLSPPQKIYDFKAYPYLRSNKSLESVAHIDENNIITIAERSLKKNGLENIPGFSLNLLENDKKELTLFSIQKTDKFDITEIDVLNGTVFFLERYFSPKEGLHIRLSSAELDTKKTIKTNELAKFGLFHQIDNFEGLSVRQTPEEKTYLYIISDNNFNQTRQKTLLLMFEWQRS